MEGEGSSEREMMEYTEIETTSESFDSSVIFHVVKNILGFILYMHQQIPSILQNMSLEFEGLNAEYKELELALIETEAKGSSRRTQLGRMREVKRGIRKLQKLMNTVSNIETALQLIITEVPDIQGVILILGPSPARPQHVYELCFSHGKVVPECGFDMSKAGEGLSKKAIRALITKGAGSSSYSGPSKLFLLVKAPSTINMPQCFLPKREFKINKRIEPLRLCLKCKRDVSNYDSQTANLAVRAHSTSTELICRQPTTWLIFRQMLMPKQFSYRQSKLDIK